MTNLNINSVVYVCVSFLNAQESRQYPRIRVVVIQWSLLFHSLYTNIKIIRKHEIISRTLISVKVFGLQSLIMIASGFYGDFWRFQGIKWKRHKSPSPKIIVSSSLVNVCFIRTGRFFLYNFHRFSSFFNNVSMHCWLSINFETNFKAAYLSIARRTQFDLFEKI